MSGLTILECIDLANSNANFVLPAEECPRLVYPMANAPTRSILQQSEIK